MYPDEKQQQRPSYSPPSGQSNHDPLEPPPSYDSHYTSSSSSLATPRRPPTPPEKLSRTYSPKKGDAYHSPHSPSSPIRSITPSPHAAGTSTLLRSSSSDLGKSGSFAQSNGDHLPPSPLMPSGLSQPSQSSPPSFHRPPPKGIPYSLFPPIALYTADNGLNKGFPRIAPETIVGPHPFSTHDVREEDWFWFLSQVKAAATAAGTDFTSIPGVTPVATHLAVSVGLGRLVNMGIEAHVKSKKTGPLAEVFDSWNQHFFHPRQLDIVLARGRFCYSGPHDGLPPDMLHKDQNQYDVYNQGGQVSDDEYSSDDSHPERTARRREKRAARRERRSHRKELRRDFICASENKWRLIVSQKSAVIV